MDECSRRTAIITIRDAKCNAHIPIYLREKFGSLATAVCISFTEHDCCSTLELLRWRVTESSQILMVLLDSRCPLLHLPPSLVNFISLPRYRVILVLTKVDISGPQRAEAWATYLRLKYPSTRVVMVESYSMDPQGFSSQEGTARRGRYEPHIPRTFKEQLVTALKEAHHELLQPPEKIKDDPEKMRDWKPRVKVDVDWDVILHSGPATRAKPPRRGSDVTAADSYEAESDVLTIGLIGTALDSVPVYSRLNFLGQPNVGKSSLLNALFGTIRVRASKTPGKVICTPRCILAA